MPFDDDERIVILEEVIEYMNLLEAEADALRGASVVVNEVVDGCQVALEAELGRPVTVREFEDSHPLRFEQRQLFLKQTPVAEVSTFTIGGVAQTSSSYAVRGYGIDFDGAILSAAFPQAVVAYTAGLDGKNDPNYSDLKLTVLRAIKRLLKGRADDTDGLDSLIVEGYNVDFTAPDSIYTDKELARVSRRKRRRAG